MTNNKKFYGVCWANYSCNREIKYDSASFYDHDRAGFEGEAEQSKSCGGYAKVLSHDEFIAELAKAKEYEGTADFRGSMVEGSYEEEVNEYRRTHEPVETDERTKKRAEAVRFIWEWENENVTEYTGVRLTDKDSNTGLIMFDTNFISTMLVESAAEQLKKKGMELYKEIINFRAFF